MEQTLRRRRRSQQSLGDPSTHTVIALIYILVIVMFLVWFGLTHLAQYD